MMKSDNELNEKKKTRSLKTIKKKQRKSWKCINHFFKTHIRMDLISKKTYAHSNI